MRCGSLTGAVLAAAFLGACTTVGETAGTSGQYAQAKPPPTTLGIDIACATLTTTADHQPAFTVTIRNLSDKAIIIPSLDSFPQREHPYYKGFHARPLYPVITPVRGVKPTYSMTGHVSMATVPATTVELLPGKSLRVEDVALTEESFVIGQQQWCNGETSWLLHYLLPPSTCRIAFCFENEQARIEGKEAWVGKVTSNELAVTVNPACTAGLDMAGTFELPKARYFLGEPITIAFKATNKGKKPIAFRGGGDYRSSGRHDRFSFSALDEAGKAVADPARHSPMGGGLGGNLNVEPGGTYTETLLVNQWCAFAKPGKYTITCRRTLNVAREGKSTYDDVEATLPAIAIETKLTVEIFRDDKALADHLIEMERQLQSQTWREAASEMQTLAYIRCEQAFATIERLARSPGPAQSEALRWLTQFGERALPALQAATKTDKAETRIAAMEIMAECDAKGTGAVVKAALQSQDGEERRAALVLCWWHKYSECLPALLDMGDDHDVIARGYLCAALRATGDPRGIPVLLRLLHDKNPDPCIPIWAASGLGKLGRKDGIPVMIDLLQAEEVKDYRGHIATTLEELTGTKMKYRDDYDSWHDWWEREGGSKFSR